MKFLVSTEMELSVGYSISCPNCSTKIVLGEEINEPNVTVFEYCDACHLQIGLNSLKLREEEKP